MSIAKCQSLFISIPLECFHNLPHNDIKIFFFETKNGIIEMIVRIMKKCNGSFELIIIIIYATHDMTNILLIRAVYLQLFILTFNADSNPPVNLFPIITNKCSRHCGHFGHFTFPSSIPVYFWIEKMLMENSNHIFEIQSYSDSI